MSNLKIAKQIPLKVLIKRISKRFFSEKQIDYTNKDFRNTTLNLSATTLIDTHKLSTNLNSELITYYLNHQFNLLGSGWKDRNLTSQLVVHKTHQAFTQQLLNLLPENYQLINWQLDVGSNFEFDICKQFNKQEIPSTKNVDIKNCWELGRLQHFPQLALLALDGESKNQLIEEFKNQSIDFIASNPVGMGVQWACAMDVGIRLCNMLVAYDLFSQIDNSELLNEAFKTIYLNSVYAHGDFILSHLESKEGLAGNHYLFNLVGLLFVSNYLPLTNETSIWKKIAEQELEIEFEKQFFNDGGNFEGSIAYHFLSAETILYTTAMMLGTGKKLSEDYILLFGRMAMFSKNCLKSNGEIPQFGDNDSGRLFKFSNPDNLLNHNSLIAGFSGLYNNLFDTESIEKLIIQSFAGNNKMNLPDIKSKGKFQLRNAEHQLQQPTTTVLKFKKEIDTSIIQLFAYDDFGLYIFKSDEFYLAISAISNPNMHHSWGHVHNDKLSFELQVNGVDLVKDPGSYTYTAFPDKRNQFRSVKAHHGIVIEGVEQNKLIDLFYMERRVKCKVLEIQKLTITLQANYYGVEHIRKFTILNNQLNITDYCNKPYIVNINKFNHYSPNYGVIN